MFTLAPSNAPPARSHLRERKRGVIYIVRVAGLLIDLFWGLFARSLLWWWEAPGEDSPEDGIYPRGSFMDAEAPQRVLEKVIVDHGAHLLAFLHEAYGLSTSIYLQLPPSK